MANGESYDGGGGDAILCHLGLCGCAYVCILMVLNGEEKCEI